MLPLMKAVFFRLVGSGFAHPFSMADASAELAGMLAVVLPARVFGVDESEVIIGLGFTALAANPLDAWLLIVCHHAYKYTRCQSFQQLTGSSSVYRYTERRKFSVTQLVDSRSDGIRGQRFLVALQRAVSLNAAA